jgi:flavin-dependent dehydrogenase
MPMNPRYDVLIIGGGKAGLSLARHLLLYSDKTILIVDRIEKLPSTVMKVGESNVQVAGHYFGKVLDLEHHLYSDHLMKYNLRFMWKTGEGKRFEDFGMSYIRHFSNIPCYQMDRNKLEGELLRLNRQSPHFHICEGISKLDVDLNKGGEHPVRFDCKGESHTLTAGWVVDTSGRTRHLPSSTETKKKSDIRHSSVFFWMDGLVNIEKLTDSTLTQIRQRPERATLGHLPFWLATNHFCGEGFWFWVIPLADKTSFGLVFDNALIALKDVSTEEKILKWLFDRFPLFERGLKGKEIIDFQVLNNYSHDCERTISEDRWAVSGLSGRFTDPLYSPGGDAIAICNTLIVDAIQSESDTDLAKKVNRYEVMMNTVYRAYLPSFQLSYSPLGDQETFSMKYVWELSVYFSWFVFPFINDLYTNSHFLIRYLGKFAQLGELNRSILVFISDYYYWKKERGIDGSTPKFFEFKDVETLERAESTFYKIGLESKAALAELDAQMESLKELARFYVAHASAVVAGDLSLVDSVPHVESIDLSSISFDASAIQQAWLAIPASQERHHWDLNSQVFSHAFHPRQPVVY